MGVLIVWTEVKLEDKAALSKAAELQREQSDWYNAKISVVSIEKKFTNPTFRIFVYETETLWMQLVVKEAKGMLHLVTCALKQGKGEPTEAALILLEKLKKLAGDLTVYAVWDNRNPEATMQFYKAVSNSELAKQAGFNSCLTVAVDRSDKGKGREDYYSEWK